MMQIAFNWTALPLLLQEKTVTRRDWKPHYAARFRKGNLITAYDQRPEWGGHAIALLQLTVDPYLELTGAMPDNDYAHEGFAFYERYPELLPKKFQGYSMPEFWREWKLENKEMWVVRFRFLDILPDGGKLIEREAKRYQSTQSTLR